MRRIVSSKFSKERFHDASRISNSSAYSIFRSYIPPFVSDASLCGTHSIRIGGVNDSAFTWLDFS